MSVQDALRAQRFGFGGFAGQWPAITGTIEGPDPMLTQFPGQSSIEALRAFEEGNKRINDARKSGDTEALTKVRREVTNTARATTEMDLRREIARAVSGPDSYRERLVRFWADHFTIIPRASVQAPFVTPYVDEAIRTHLTAPFAQMLKAAILHPAMLRYLDQSASVGPRSPIGTAQGKGLNENLGRELLELHTLGTQGGYTQEDVRQTALLLTGLRIDSKSETGFTFAPRRAEPGAETVLGRAYGGKKASIADIEALLDDLANHPATARHLSGKLATHFVSDTPPEGLVADLTAVWLTLNGDLPKVFAALASHPLANGPTLDKARQPFDFLIASLRALGVTGEEVMAWEAKLLRTIASGPMKQMGQPWHAPNGPDGWEEGFERWITPQGLASRIDWAMQMPRRLTKDLPDARAFTQMALGELAPPDLATQVARAETNTEGVGLVLASPQFNRR